MQLKINVHLLFFLISNSAIMEVDTNMDGYVDQSELEEMLHSRDARDLLEMADEDGEWRQTSL